MPAPAPGLHHDCGQITTSIVLLGVQVPALAPAPGLHHDCGQITPDHNLCVAMQGKSLGVSEVRGQMASGVKRWVKSCGHGSCWGSAGSNHVDTEVAGGQIMVKACRHGSRRGVSGVKACGGWGQRGSKHVDTGVAGGQIMVKACGTGVTGGQRGSKHVVAGVSGGQIMLTREWLGVSGGQIMLTRESLGGVKSC